MKEKGLATGDLLNTRDSKMRSVAKEPHPIAKKSHHPKLFTLKELRMLHLRRWPNGETRLVDTDTNFASDWMSYTPAGSAGEYPAPA